MLNNTAGGYLTDLLDNENISEDERKRIVVISTALNMISVAVSTEESNHRLSDEMQNLEKYVKQIESLLKCD